MQIPPPVVPVRMRPATDNAIGTTAFFRNRPLLDTLLFLLKNDVGSSYKVLFHACSIGAEVYSIVVRYLALLLNAEFGLNCFATDRESGFVDFAKNARYPVEVLESMLSMEKPYFVAEGEQLVVHPEVQGFTHFLPPCDFSTYCPKESFDVVFLLNALVYVSAEAQRKTLKNISEYNSRYLVVTAFHSDTIEKDLKDSGYQPVLDNQEVIHENWLDRRVNTKGDVRTSQIFADWRLPQFSKIEGHEYKYCALFMKQN